MASSQLALALSAPWGDLKLSGRKIKELFYTQVAPPEGADSDLPHFRCRCGKIRIQSLKHGYTNLKQHLMFKHPTWVLEHAEEIQATPPNSPKLERPSAAAVAATNARKGKGKAAAATTVATATAAATATVTTTATAAATAKPDVASPAAPTPATATGRKKRKMSNGAADQDAAAEPPAKAAPVTRRSRASSAASLASSPPSPPPAAVPSAVVPSAKATLAAASTQTIHKRDDYISWDDYFMSVAFLSAMRSKDPSTQVGACIVNSEKKIVGIGYNGFPNGCSDDTLPWARESAAGDPLETKYPFVCHAEMNAILNKNASDLKGCTIYVALFPCNECAKLIIQSGITHIVYLSDKYHDDWKMVASRRMLDMARVEYRQHHVSKPSIVIDFSAIA